MILREFLDNPIGRGDASVNMKVLKDALDIKYNNYYKNKKTKIEMKVYRQPKKDVYWVHLILPTETERDNTYDVVYKFANPKPLDRTALGIGKFDIQIFANTPSFAYTYSYVYNSNGLLIPSLSNKLGKVFLTKEPKIRNRNRLMLYDKYVYFGARYILDSKVLNRAIADIKSIGYDERHFNSTIRSLPVILDEYRKAEEKLRGKRKGVKYEKDKKRSQRSSETESVNRVTGSNSTVKSVSKKSNKKTPVKKTNSTIKKR